MNEVLFESQRYLTNFIQSFRFIQYVSELFFDEEDMIDPIKELNNTIEEIFLNQEQKNLGEKNRKSFLRKGISFIEKGKVIKNKDQLTKINLNKMNSIDNMFDEMLMFISSIEIISTNSSEIIKDNYDFLRTVFTDNIFSLKEYFVKFNENLLYNIRKDDISPKINNTFNLFIIRIKKFQNKYIGYLKNNMDIQEDNSLSDKNIKKNRLRDNRYKLNRRTLKKNEISNSIDYKREIGKYLLNIKTMKIIYKLFNKGLEKIYKVIFESHNYSKKINELYSQIQKQKTSFDKILTFSQPKDLNKFLNLSSRKHHTNYSEKYNKTRIYNDYSKKSLFYSQLESEYVSKYNSIYFNLEMDEFTKEANKLSEADFISKFKNIWNQLVSVMNKLLNNEFENKLNIVSEIINFNNFDSFIFKKDFDREKINSLFDYFDASKLILDSEKIRPLVKYENKLNITLSSLDEQLSNNINLGFEMKIIEYIIYDFKNTVNNYLYISNLNKNEKDDFDGFGDNKNNLNKNLLITYLDSLDENIRDIKIISNEFSRIKENLLKLNNLIINLLDKKYQNEEINNLKKEEENTLNQLKNITEQLENMKNKSLTDLPSKENKSDNETIKLNITKNNKMVKNSSLHLKATNITLNITYSDMHKKQPDKGSDILIFIITIILILLIIVIYISIFKKIVYYSINFLINSNYKISFLNKSTIFWTLALISLISAILGKLLYSNWVFLFVNYSYKIRYSLL